MICCKLHPDAGTLIRLKGPHIGAYCKQCGKWLKWIAIDEVDECVKPELDETVDVKFTPNTLTTTLVEHSEPSEDDDDVPW
jgi:hypothetical protein